VIDQNARDGSEVGKCLGSFGGAVLQTLGC
jgi:hypothetical protein